LFVLLYFIFWPLCCLFFFDIRILITPLVPSDYPFGIFWLPLWYLRFTTSDYPFGIFWLSLWYLLITPLVSSDYPFGIFWLPLWYLRFTTSDYPFGIFWLSPFGSFKHFLVMKGKTKNTALSEQLQNPMENSRNLINSIPLTHIYTTARFPGLLQALQ
jgi:hypothetical protein